MLNGKTCADKLPAFDVTHVKHATFVNIPEHRAYKKSFYFDKHIGPDKRHLPRGRLRPLGGIG
jgi:hypothetical protein